MKHYLSIFSILLLFVSCGPPEFKKNTRVLIKGNIVDENNNPIPNIEINIFTGRSSDYLLGSGLSKQDGTFSITSLFDSDDEFQIVVNGKDTYSTYYYLTNTKNYIPEDLVFDLKTVALNRISNVNFNITRISTKETIFEYSFQFKNTNCFEFFDKGILDIITSNCLKEVHLNRLLNQNNPEVSSGFTTLLGSIVEFKYSKNDEPEITETLTIDKENYEFKFSY